MGIYRFDLPAWFDVNDLEIQDDGGVIIKANAYPAPDDLADDHVVKVGLTDGRIMLQGIDLDRHLSNVRFKQRIEGQQAGWYHWDQIEELTLSRNYGDELCFRVVVKKGSKPWSWPGGIVNYYLNVGSNGVAVYHPDATDAEHREIKAEFDEFKLGLQANAQAR